MARILIADDGIEFDGNTARERPLGGVESSIINLAGELAKRGHEVSVRNMCHQEKKIDGVFWAPLVKNGEYNIPEPVDLYIANRGHKLINLMPASKRTAFWIHNPARYLLKWRYLYRLWRFKPEIIFIGNYHASTYPNWAPGGERFIIPYGITREFKRANELKEIPSPKAIFTSNPLRSLDWLLDVWVNRIIPEVPNAQLHLFSGSQTYGSVGDLKAKKMEDILLRASQLQDKGVVIRGPIPKSQLIQEFSNSRVMLYRGDLNETFCLAVGEAQAAGVPAVVQNLGSVVERVSNGKTGIIANSDKEFSDAAIAILNDDNTWQNYHRNAVKLQGFYTWERAANAFEELINL